MGQLSTSSTIVSKPRYIEFSPVGEIKPLTWGHFRPASPGGRLTKCGSSDRGNWTCWKPSKYPNGHGIHASKQTPRAPFWSICIVLRHLLWCLMLGGGLSFSHQEVNACGCCCDLEYQDLLPEVGAAWSKKKTKKWQRWWMIMMMNSSWWWMMVVVMVVLVVFRGVRGVRDVGVVGDDRMMGWRDGDHDGHSCILVIVIDALFPTVTFLISLLPCYANDGWEVSYSPCNYVESVWIRTGLSGSEQPSEAHSLRFARHGGHQMYGASCANGSANVVAW